MSSLQQRFGGVVSIAAIAGLAAAIWTVVTYQPPKEALEAQREMQGRAERSRAIAERVGGFRNAESQIRAMWASGQVGEALQLAREWSRGNDQDIVAGYWRIALLVNAGDLERARRVASSRFALVTAKSQERPDDPEVWYYRGWYERALGLSEEAEASFDTAVQLLRAQGPKRMSDEVWHYNIACYEALRGNTEDGLNALEQAVELGWADVAWMCVDPDLAGLRAHERFVSLSVRMAGHGE